jgi:hypothetical protein
MLTSYSEYYLGRRGGRQESMAGIGAECDGL